MWGTYKTFAGINNAIDDALYLNMPPPSRYEYFLHLFICYNKQLN